MKVKHHNDEKLLTRIRRSYWNIPEYKKKEGPVSSRLFSFESLECKTIEGNKRAMTSLRCIKVKVMATGETYIATQRIDFGRDDWTLFKIVEEK